MASEQDPSLIAPLILPDERNAVETRVRGAQQRLDEAQRSLEALLADIHAGTLEMGDALAKQISALQRIIEQTSEELRSQSERSDVAHQKEGDALSEFVRFTEDLRRRVAAEAQLLRHKELEYRDGDLSAEEYRVISDQREHFYSVIESQLRQQARNVDTSTRPFREAEQFIREQLVPLHELTPQERLDRYWLKSERALLPFIKAYDLLRESVLTDPSRREGLEAAWHEKHDAFERYRKKIQSKRGFTPDEQQWFLKRARALLRPDEPLAVPEKSPRATQVSWQKAREAYENAREKYSTVQHRLTLDERIRFRTQLAQLATHMHHAEIHASVARATEHAPALAHAVMASHHRAQVPSKSRSWFATLSRSSRR